MTAAPTVPMSPPREGQPPWYQMMSWQAWVYVVGGTAIAVAETCGIQANRQTGPQQDFKKRTISEFIWWLGGYHRDSYDKPHAKWRRLAVDVLFMWFPGHVRSAGERY